MSYHVSLGQSLKNMMQSEFQNRLRNQKSIFTNDKSLFTNDISLILDRGPMIGYIWSHAPPCTSSNSNLIYCGYVLMHLTDTQKAAILIFPMTNVTILGVFRTLAQKEYGKVWEMKSIPILKFFSSFTFLNLAMHLLKVWFKRHPV